MNRSGWAVLLLAVAAAGLAGRFPAPAGSLPTVESGHRPGPDILYARPAHAPQLRNVGVWHAPPILISATSAYRDGEFLYQDLLYDDHGARGQRDPADPRRTVDETAATPNGSYTYPTNPAYAGNAADFVEIRVKPLADATAFRVTLNSLADPVARRVHDRDRRHAGRAARDSTRGRRARAGGPLPDRARTRRRAARRRHRATRRRPGASRSASSAASSTCA